MDYGYADYGYIEGSQKIKDGFNRHANPVDVDFNPKKLLSLGFKVDEITVLSTFVQNNLTLSGNNFARLGITNYEAQQRLKYMYSFCIGKTEINTDEDLIKHLKRMNSKMPKIGMANLQTSKINSVPRAAIIGNIRQTPFDIYNSKNYKKAEGLYIVENITSNNVIIRTSRKPQLKYGASKKIEGVIEILPEPADRNGRIQLAVNKSYCKLCNRFIIAASIKRPEFYLGMYKIICIEGTTVYVYAQSMGTRDTVKYNMSTQRVYSYGIFEEEIPIKLKAVAQEMYKNLHGVKVEQIGGNTQYILLPLEKQEVEEENDIE